MTEPGAKQSGQETIKRQSHGLRGTIAEELANDAPDISDPAYELLKFHGSYFGYDRDTATERKQQGLDKHYEFMLRLKMPGGRLTAEQYLALDGMVDTFANGTLRITTRETFQFHCIVKPNMKPFVAAINRTLLSTLGGCGDVVRNVITCPAPEKTRVKQEMQDAAWAIAMHCAPRTTGYLELWLDGEKLPPEWNGQPETGDVEPLYGDVYMPRKFKIALGEPEDNCMDALTNDLAFLALTDETGHIHGYNVAVGGGLGMKHNNAKTYPRLASEIAYVPSDLLLPATEAVVKLQRDHGDRGDRQHARLKYLVAEKGVEWARAEFLRYLGRDAEAPRPVTRWGIDDHMGWHPQGDGKWYLGVPIPSGRIADAGEERIRTALREVISTYRMPLVLTADQNILLCDIEDGERAAIAATLRAHGVRLIEDITLFDRNFMACVALPTCGKALAEAERVRNPLTSGIETVLARHGLTGEKIAVRIAGCPNGCSRPYVGDIGFVGRTPGTYALYVGGDFEGTRLNEKIFDKVPLEALPAALDPMLAVFRDGREAGEGFGDYCRRVGVATVKQAAVEALSPAHPWAA